MIHYYLFFCLFCFFVTHLLCLFIFIGHSSEQLIQSIKNTEPNYSKYISPLAKDFISNLLQKDPLKRMNLETALNHPFLALENNNLNNSNNNSERTVSPIIINQTQNQVFDVASSLESYYNLCKFNKLLCKAVAFSLKPSQINHLSTIFNSIDTDRNGYVSIKELQVIISLIFTFKFEFKSHYLCDFICNKTCLLFVEFNNLINLILGCIKYE